MYDTITKINGRLSVNLKNMCWREITGISVMGILHECDNMRRRVSMKKVVLLLLALVSCPFAIANTDSVAEQTKLDSIYWAEREAYRNHYNDSVRESQKNDVERFKLYKTENMWTFIELDTQTGRTWQVQYSTNGPSYRFRTALDDESKLWSYDLPVSGRFELYATTNTYNFILLDRIDGRCWQVQWSINEENRMCLPIY